MADRMKSFIQYISEASPMDYFRVGFFAASDPAHAKSFRKPTAKEAKTAPMGAKWLRPGVVSLWVWHRGRIVQRDLQHTQQHHTDLFPEYDFSEIEAQGRIDHKTKTVSANIGASERTTELITRKLERLFPSYQLKTA
jgi:hypothetical protein